MSYSPKRILKIISVLLLFLVVHSCAPKTYTSLEEALKNPEKVESLTLGWGKLTVFPKEIFRFKNLRRLNLKNNHLSTLPAKITELNQLERIDLSNNWFKTLPQGLDKLPRLKRLYLMRNPIPKELRAEIAKKLPNCTVKF